MREPHVAADHGTFSNHDRAEDGRASVDYYIVLDVRMPFHALDECPGHRIFVERKSTQSHTLVQLDVAAYYRRLADDDARSVVDEEPLP